MTESLYNSEYTCPYVQLPKVWRFLSYIDEGGTRRRFDGHHLAVLSIYMELDECWKTNKLIALEAGIGTTKLDKVNKALESPTVETGEALIAISRWRDSDGHKRTTIQFTHRQETLGRVFDEMFDPEFGEGRRLRWLGLFAPKIVDELIEDKAKKDLAREKGLARETGKDQKPSPRGGQSLAREAGYNNPKEERTEKELSVAAAPVGSSASGYQTQTLVESPLHTVNRDATGHNHEQSQIGNLDSRDNNPNDRNGNGGGACLNNNRTNKLTQSDVYRLATKYYPDWTTAEIAEAWGVMVSYQGPIHDELKFLAGTIANIRKKKISEKAASGGRGKCNKEKNRCDAYTKRRGTSCKNSSVDAGTGERILHPPGLLARMLSESKRS